MQIRIRSRDVLLPPAARRRLEDRLRLVIGPRAGGIARVDLALGAAPAGAGTRCRIRVQPRSGPALAVIGEQREPALAVDEAAWRLAHRLAGRGEDFGAGGMLAGRQGGGDGRRSHPDAASR
jgi:ribosome-associated translation inhibitor RaiA